ncbi:putative reverse transcriptase domain-containing protein [Tanacetum coccineum]
MSGKKTSDWSSTEICPYCGTIEDTNAIEVLLFYETKIWHDSRSDESVKLHHVGSCTVKCSNCKRVGHMTRDCKTSVAAMNQRAHVANPKATITCYECGRLGHFRNECQNEEEHAEHLKLILELLKKEELYAKISNCEFWLSKVQFLGHVIDSEGIHMDPAKIESIKDWASPKTLTEIQAVFQLLKQKLCSAPILALPKGSENFMVYYDASHQKELNMRQHKWLDLLSSYDCEIRYHPGKANVVADALSRKERIRPLRVRALVLMICLNLPVHILNAQVKARKEENFGTEDLCRMIKKLEKRADGTLCLNERSWIPC